ncbi:hypothetical protein Ndes2526B_g05224 [Nannochloris sp. 'desiccata']|nr:hypothetical protein NADE_008253 [Chlorella desiccata (nom. nud.)]
MNYRLYFESRKGRLLQIVAAVAAVIIFFISVSHFQTGSKNKATHKSNNIYLEEYGCGVHVERIRGQDVVWELPRQKPRGVIMFAHGCHHAAGDLWPPSPQCQTCLGLPEERRLRIAALHRRLALIGISSLDRVGKRCWAELRKDGGRNVANILREWIERQGLRGVPLYTMGASSGGQLALTLPRHMRVAGVYAQVRGVENTVLQLPKGRMFPPTVFVHMPRDEDNAAIIRGNIETLKNTGTPVLELKIHPRPVTVEFLTERSPLIDETMAEGIVNALKKSGIVAENGSLTEPPRPATEKWAPLVQPVIGDLSLTLDESHVGELVNLAWAKHELVSDEAEAIMTWLQHGGGRELDGIEDARRKAEQEGEVVWNNKKVKDSSGSYTSCQKYK